MIDVTLSSGRSMPLVGFGTWPLKGDIAHHLTRHALDVGYRHIDTATFYDNEASIGRAVRDSGLHREDVFITTKMPPGNAGRERETLESSLALLGLDHVDLWLVHWPPGGHAAPQTWAEFLRARDDGLATDVGVSNYSLGQVDELIERTGVAPAVNQIQYGPSLHDRSTLAGLRDRGVRVAGWSPFKSTNLQHPTITDAARRHDVSPAQVVVRWHVQHEIACLPRSSDEGRIAANGDVLGFELSAEQMKALDSLSR